MKLFTKFLVLSFLTTSISAMSAETITHTMKCSKMFGNPIFNSIEVKYTTAAKGGSDRPVSVVVKYKHSGLDNSYYTKPFTINTTVYNVSNGSGMPEDITFDDTTFGNGDYSGGTIKFTTDENLGLLALIEYRSDGPSFFGVLSCSNPPEFKWNVQ